MADTLSGQGAQMDADDSGAGNDKSPLTLKEAHTLLAAARPAAVLTLLKDPDFAMIAGIAFMGFRMDARSYANPLVRRRLAEEAVRNPDFSRKLRGAVQESRHHAQSAPGLPRPAHVAKPLVAAAPAPPIDSAKYRAERDRLKQERDTAVEAQRAAERSYGQARTGQLAAETARAEAEREAERLRQRVERHERRLRRLETENAALRRAAVGAFSESARQADLHDDQPVRTLSPEKSAQPERHFAAAVRRLLDKEKWSLAVQLANDVLRSAPDDPDALAIRARAEEGQGHTREAISDLRRLVPAQITRYDLAGAAQSLVQLLVLTPRPASETRLIRELYSGLARSPSELEKAREAFERARSSAPAVYSLLQDFAQDDLAKSLFGSKESGALGPDDPLPLPTTPLHGLILTARRLIAVIDRNDTALFEAARKAARNLTKEVLALIEEGLRSAGGGDASYFHVLVRPGLEGAVIVDASNVAWHGQEMIVGGKPRMAHLTALRSGLRERGRFPTLLIADANLPFVVDEPARVRQMVKDGELALAPSGTDADEYILREARRLGAPVVSNDYMADWDPEQTVAKVQYDISLVDGRATLYF
ncbi:MAG TPA: hypothetical protein VFW40_07005 [Capsulimonadaceae bacterium]|nr:hypothetical protein [Capsulimonadaceae bacterium]